MDILPIAQELFSFAHTSIRKSLLPNGHIRPNAMRETTLYEPHRTLQRYVPRSDQQMYVLGHNDEAV
jgi:hypothetical protein